MGDADSIWIKSVIEKTYLPFDDHVTILTGRNSVFRKYYENNNVKVVLLKDMHHGLNILNVIKNISVVRKEYDIINVHFISSGTYCLLAKIGMLYSKKLILFFWGSDILRTKKRRLLLETAFNSASSIMLSTNEMVEKFHLIYGLKYDKKIRRANFGAIGVELLKEKKYDIDFTRQKYNIDYEKIIITVGYNRMIAQQHMKVIEAINQMPQEKRNRIHLLFRLTYGNGDREYIKRIEDSLQDKGYTFTLFLEYLTDEEVAEITAITDIFVQAQISDARSATMQEHLYAKCLVINPSWIHYSEIEDKVFYLKYDTFDEFASILQENLVKKEDSIYKTRLNENSKSVYDMSSWDALVPTWRDIYMN